LDVTEIEEMVGRIAGQGIATRGAIDAVQFRKYGAIEIPMLEPTHPGSIQIYVFALQRKQTIPLRCKSVESVR
jgi:hypothetical protein